MVLAKGIMNSTKESKEPPDIAAIATDFKGNGGGHSNLKCC